MNKKKATAMEMSDKTAAKARIFTGKFSVIRKKMLWDTQNRNEVQACGKLGKIYSVLSYNKAENNTFFLLFSAMKISMNSFSAILHLGIAIA